MVPPSIWREDIYADPSPPPTATVHVTRGQGTHPRGHRGTLLPSAVRADPSCHGASGLVWSVVASSAVVTRTRSRFSCLHARRPRRSAPRESTTIFSSSRAFDRYHNLPCCAPRKCPRTLLQQQQQLPAATSGYKFGTMIGVMIVILSLPHPVMAAVT